MLRNNYTTPEQSQRLLELGLPSSSSDCYYRESEIEGNMYWFEICIKKELQPHSCLHADGTQWCKTLSCWSLGQLIQIYAKCVRPGVTVYLFEGDEFPDIMTEILWKICNAIQAGKFDFSKLKSFQSKGE